MASHLSQHPEIAFSNPKEPHFFSPDFPFGSVQITDVNDYRSLFPITKGTTLLAEGSVFYLYSREAIRAIEEVFSRKARYIVCLRNPVDASFSLHAQHIAFGWEAERSYISALKRETVVPLVERDREKIAKILRYREIYSFAPHLRRLMNEVEQERVFYFVMEEHATNMQSFYDELHQFLDVIPITVRTEKRMNEARRIGNDLFYRVLTAPITLRTARYARKLLAPNGFGIGRPIRQISRDERRDAAAVFADDIAETAKIVGFNPDLWLQE